MRAPEAEAIAQAEGVVDHLLDRVRRGRRRRRRQPAVVERHHAIARIEQARRHTEPPRGRAAASREEHHRLAIRGTVDLVVERDVGERDLGHETTGAFVHGEDHVHRRGSTVFARNLLGDILMLDELADSEIALFDIDAERLATSAARCVARRRNVQRALAKIEATTDRRAALDGADFAII